MNPTPVMSSRMRPLDQAFTTLKNRWPKYPNSENRLECKVKRWVVVFVA